MSYDAICEPPKAPEIEASRAEGGQPEIRPSMVFSIEPGIYLPEVGGFRHSDTVAITETGNHKMGPHVEKPTDLTITV